MAIYSVIPGTIRKLTKRCDDTASLDDIKTTIDSSQLTRDSRMNVQSTVTADNSAGTGPIFTGQVTVSNGGKLIINNVYTDDSKINIYQTGWNEIKDNVNIDTLVKEILTTISILKESKVEPGLIEHDRTRAVCILLAASEEAKNNNGPGILKHLDKLKSLSSSVKSIIMSAGGQILGDLILAYLGIGAT